MNNKKTTSKTYKKIKRMIIVGCIMLVTMFILTPALFFASISTVLQTRKDIKQVSRTLNVTNSVSQLEKIAKNDRVLEIMAVDKNGAVIYTLKNMPIFSDPNATVLYDAETGLIKVDGGRISYLQRGSIIGALLDIGDDDDDFDYDDDDDDDRIPSFDYRFVKDNTYQTVALSDDQGNTVYIICTRDGHTGFILYMVFIILLWSIVLFYIFVAASYAAYKTLTFTTCSSCGLEIRRGINHCTKCGASQLPKICANCGTPASKSDQICGECGEKLP